MRRRREVRLVGDAAARVVAHGPRRAARRAGRRRGRAPRGRRRRRPRVGRRASRSASAATRYGRSDCETNALAPGRLELRARRGGARDGGGAGGETRPAESTSAAGPPRARSAQRQQVSNRPRGTAAGTAAQSTGPQSSSARSSASPSDRAARLGGRQLGDRADAEGVHEPRRLPRRRRGRGSPRRRAPRRAAASRRRRARSAAGRAGGAPASRGISSSRRSSRLRREHAGRADGEAVERRQRVIGVPDAAEAGAEAAVVLGGRPVDEAPGDRLASARRRLEASRQGAAPSAGGRGRAVGTGSSLRRRRSRLMGPMSAPRRPALAARARRRGLRAIRLRRT